MNDIDKAIQDAGSVKMIGIQGTLKVSGRPFNLQVPHDMTEAEALAIVEVVAGLPLKLRQSRGPRLVVPTPVLVRQ